MKNGYARLWLYLLIPATLGWNANALETNEQVTGADYTADLGKCRLTFSKYGTFTSIYFGGKKLLSGGFLLLHYADAGKVDSRVYEQANQEEDAVRNPARVTRNEHGVTLTKQSILGHVVNPESVQVNREIILDDHGKLTARFEIEYLKDVVLTAPPLFLMSYELAFLSGGYMIDGKLGVLQDAFAEEGQFQAGGSKIQFATEFGALSLEAMNKTIFSGYDLRRGKPGQGRSGQALRIDAYLRPGIYAPRYPFAKGTKQSFGFTLTLPGL